MSKAEDVLNSARETIGSERVASIARIPTKARQRTVFRSVLAVAAVLAGCAVLPQSRALLMRTLMLPIDEQRTYVDDRGVKRYVTVSIAANFPIPHFLPSGYGLSQADIGDETQLLAVDLSNSFMFSNAATGGTIVCSYSNDVTKMDQFRRDRRRALFDSTLNRTRLPNGDVAVFVSVGAKDSDGGGMLLRWIDDYGLLAIGATMARRDVLIEIADSVH